MSNINKSIGCDVEKCEFNSMGCNCTLDQIKVGCTCNEEHCTCCASYQEK